MGKQDVIQEVHNVIFTTSPREDRATAIGNMHKEFGEVWTCDGS